MRFAAVYEHLCCSKDAGTTTLLAGFAMLDMLTSGLVGTMLGGMAALMLAAITRPDMTAAFFEAGALLGLAAGSLRRGIDVAAFLHDIRCPEEPRAKRSAASIPGMLFPFLIFAWASTMSGVPLLLLAGVAVEAVMAVRVGSATA